MAIFTGGEVFFAPMPEQNKARRNCVEQPALRHEHRQWNTFPGDVVDVLIIDELEIFQKLKPGQTTVEKKTGDGKAAPPAVKRVEGDDRRQQSNPNQTGD